MRENVSVKSGGNSIRDIMVVAAMAAMAYITSSLVGMLTMSIPAVYLYGSAGIVMAATAVFFLIVANRINKHGILFVWAVLNGMIMLLQGYGFMLPYFIGIGIVSELTMLGKDTYIKPIRTTIGWSVYGLGMMIGNAYPVWMSWEQFVASAPADGFSDKLLEMEYNLYTQPMLLVLGCLITVVLTAGGCVIANSILKRHFKKAGAI